MAEPPLDVNNLVIAKHSDQTRDIYGCKHGSGGTTKFIVGVGCILYDKNLQVVMLGNEYNKQQRILHLNPGLERHRGYYEDFGGKIEYKHVNMHIFDVALGELFEETAMLFNLHYDDMKTCFDKKSYVLIDVPHSGDLQYLCMVIPFNLQEFQRIRDKFHENIKAITNSTITCQKQFYEISDVRFFQVEKLQAMTQFAAIKGFYGLSDHVYMCEELCQQHYYISSRIMSAVLKFPSIEFSRDYVTGDLYNLNGIQHFVSKKYSDEAKDTEKMNSILMYLQKYFVSRLDSTSPNGAKIAIGGDIPLMYYNEIMGAESKAPLEAPRLVIYTDNPCYVLFDNVSMSYDTDKTDVYLTKWGMKAAKYTCGTFFQLNDRIYFSYQKDDEEYNRVFIGIVRLLDDSIITYDDIIYKQILAVEVCSSMHIQCMKKLLDEKKTKTDGDKIEIEYFHDDVIASVRRQNPAALKRFAKYCSLEDKYISDLKDNVGGTHLKGKYALFNHVTKLCCEKNISFNGKTIESKKPTETKIDTLFAAITRNLYPVVSSSKLCRASLPFEFDCEASGTSPSIFALKADKQFVYNGIMWVSEKPKDKNIPDFYLGAGLYDCFIVQPPKVKSAEGQPAEVKSDEVQSAEGQPAEVKSPEVKSAEVQTPFIVPYYRFNDSSFQFYSVAYECIIPPGVTFKVVSVKFGLISVCSLKEESKSLINEETKKTYWRRIITITPVFTASSSLQEAKPTPEPEPESEPAPEPAPESAGGKIKSSKSRSKSRSMSSKSRSTKPLNEEFY